MLNPFSKKPDSNSVPQPKWPPIQSLDSIDLTGKRTDGGVDLIIAASQPLDASPQTLDSIRQKIGTYLAALGHAPFLAELGNPPRQKLSIVIVCEHPIHPQALNLIAAQCALAAGQGINLELRKSLREAPLPLPDARAAQLGIPDNPVQPLIDDERNRIVRQVETVQRVLQARYGNVQLRRTEDDLQWLQRLYDEGLLRAGQSKELECVGIVFGQVLAAQTPLRWVSVLWQGQRVPALEYPNTTLNVFPAGMIAKRIERGERVDFVALYRSLVTEIEKAKTDPKYRKQ